MGWTVAEGSRFSGSTPPPPRPPAIRPRKRGYLNSLAGLFLVPGGVESTSRPGATPAHSYRRPVDRGRAPTRSTRPPPPGSVGRGWAVVG